MQRFLLTAVALLAASTFVLAAEADPPEPATSWKYPPDMPGSRVEVPQGW